MKSSANFQTRGKLFLGLGLISVILMAVIVIAYVNIHNMLRIQEHLYKEHFAAALDFKEIMSDQNAVREDALIMILSQKNPAVLKFRHQDIKERADVISKNIQQVRVFMKDEPIILSKIEEFDSLRKLFEETRDNKVIPLLLAGKVEEAKKFSLGIQTERVLKLRSMSNDLVVLIEKSAEDQMANSKTLSEKWLRVFIAMGIVAILISITTAFFMNNVVAEREMVEDRLRETSSYSRSLLEASLDPLVTISPEGKITDVNKATEEVTGLRREQLIGSDFSDYFTEPLKAREGYQKVISAGFVKDYPLTVRHLSGRTIDVLYNATVYADEKGSMQGVFAAARDVTERKRMEENLRNVMAEVQESVNVLAPASSEILNITSQVASSASETATAVSETTTTVEEVKQTTIMSNQKAQYVAEIAQKTAQASLSGRKSVGEAIEHMGRIREQMESIAESIVKLSEQGQTIGEIIATVNDLAEQSNILAVNAAIEAARAGEQGKGFAVVAQEVKSLADQSKQATSQVRTILGDIQKATNSAVMATEQGSKAVEAGVSQSTQAGESIRLLADSIVEAAQASMQIAASSQQQLAGMDQIVVAMENIKTASTQNVDGSRQTEMSARNLHELGQKLKKLVEQYKR